MSSSARARLCCNRAALQTGCSGASGWSHVDQSRNDEVPLQVCCRGCSSRAARRNKAAEGAGYGVPLERGTKCDGTGGPDTDDEVSASLSADSTRW
ncbi:hypothetical protein NDU88_005398 [Pleurodeles waltl]|uniref:Uncharacterized protein n=1 Tax=Pleurodeles waltl TaxID=8319 RepID=A0AAV7PIF4_PLEWA|nr:hypothetical protein NDU88_005398 [Pleurodeles waltl]